MAAFALWIPGGIGFRHVLGNSGGVPQVLRQVIDRAACVVPAKKEHGPLGIAGILGKVGAAIPGHRLISYVGPLAAMATGPIHVHADDLLEVIGCFTDIDIAAHKIGVSVSSFGLLQQPIDVGVGDFECVSDWTVGIPAYGDQNSRLVLKEAVGASSLLVTSVCVYEARDGDHGFSPGKKKPSHQDGNGAGRG